MPTLDHSCEYLVWFEPHRDRWVATPIVRDKQMILDSDYTRSVTLVLVVDPNPQR